MHSGHYHAITFIAAIDVGSFNAFVVVALHKLHMSAFELLMAYSPRTHLQSHKYTKFKINTDIK